ncbi:MAG: hypothetical protein Q7J15_00040 [Candidatus Desulfaltia sp.]|nr:hypothetical protein [Candidatus Desulfaltia sp.]
MSDSNFPELANSFVCASMIHESNGEWSAATWALIHAAWACDDASQSPQAVTCRKRAAAMLRKAQASGQTLSDQPGAITTILVDLLRRAGELDEAAKVIQESKATKTEDTVIRIMEYQTELIQANDIGCHTIAEALGEETDHGVNESKPARKRWWQFWQ